MRIFKVDKDTQVVCEARNTRNGFKHEATLLRGVLEIAKAKVCYLNRTWERYTYESVIYEVLAKAGYSAEKIKKIVDKYAQ